VDELQTEEEQIEAIRAWWKEYGNYVIAGIAVAILGVFGYNARENAAIQERAEASALYATLSEHIEKGRVDDAEIVVEEIGRDYGNSAYAGQSKLDMARLYMDQNRDADAAEVLRELIEMDGIEELRQVARTRLARILIYQGKRDEAIDTVDSGANDAFAARFLDVKGDALAELGRFDEARAAYTEALDQENAAQTIDVGFVRLKLLDLPAPMATAMDDAAADDADAPIQPTAEPVMEEASPEDATPTASDVTDGENAPSEAEDE